MINLLMGVNKMLFQVKYIYDGIQQSQVVAMNSAVLANNYIYNQFNGKAEIIEVLKLSLTRYGQLTLCGV